VAGVEEVGAVLCTRVLGAQMCCNVVGFGDGYQPIVKRVVLQNPLCVALDLLPLPINETTIAYKRRQHDGNMCVPWATVVSGKVLVFVAEVGVACGDKHTAQERRVFGKTHGSNSACARKNTTEITLGWMGPLNGVHAAAVADHDGVLVNLHLVSDKWKPDALQTVRIKSISIKNTKHQSKNGSAVCNGANLARVHGIWHVAKHNLLE
jgi:hypothetical protein